MSRKPFKRTRGTTFRGRSNVPLREVANELCLSYPTVYNRVVYKHETGDDIERGHVMHDKTPRTTTFRGKKNIPLREVAKTLGIPYSHVFRRCAVGRATGDDLGRELAEGGYRDKRSPLVTIDGVTKTRAEWQREFGINKMTVSSRLRLGWPIERALAEPVDKKKRPTAKLERGVEP